MTSGETKTFEASGEIHDLTILDISGLQASFEFRSEPQRFNLTVGQSIDLDINADNRSDVRIKLNSIDGSDVGFSIASIEIAGGNASGQGLDAMMLAAIVAIIAVVTVAVVFLIRGRSRKKKP